VSPLTLALATVHGRLSPAIRVSSTAGKLSGIDGVTARLSPSTTTRRTVADAREGADGLAPHAASRQTAIAQATGRN